MNRSEFYLSFLVICAAFLFCARPINVSDLSIWTALGRDSLHLGQIVIHDTYTHLATTDMVYPVLAPLIYGLLFGMGGLKLVAFLHAFVPAAIVLLWVSATRPKMHWDWKTIYLYFVSLAGISLVLIPRPALLATLPLLISYIALTKPEKLSWRDCLLLFLLQVVWVNLHGSFLLMPLMAAWSLLGVLNDRQQLIRRATLCLGLGLATLVNPFTWRFVTYAWETALISKERGLDEWLPTSAFLHPVASLCFYLGSLALVVHLIQLLRQKQTTLFIVFTNPIIPLWLAGFTAIRHTFLLFLLLPVFACRVAPLTRTASPQKEGSAQINLAIIVLFLLVTLGLSPMGRSSLSSMLPTELQPTFSLDSHLPKMDRFLMENRGAIFNEFELGSDLALNQPNQYFLDTRNIIFPQESVDLYNEFLNHPVAQMEKIKGLGFQFILLSTVHARTIAELRTSSLVTGVMTEVMTEGPATLFVLKP